MKVVSFINQKGGVGKTTLAINVARGLELSGLRVVLIDTDPQGSLMDWEEKSTINMDMNVAAVLDKSIKRSIDKIDTDLVDWVVIDSSSKITQPAIETIKVSDIVLVPITPSGFDLWAAQKSVALIKELTVGRPGFRAAFVINAEKRGTKSARRIREHALKMGIDVFSRGTSLRQIYSVSTEDGLTVFDSLDRGREQAASEVSLIVGELMEYSNGGCL